MKGQSLLRNVARLAAGAATVAFPISTWAQAPADARSNQTAENVGIEDIVVTAQRRSESVQKVPISIQVLTSETLARAQIADVRDVATIAPSVNFSNSAGAMVTSFGIRGIVSVATAPGVQPSVALVVDGAPVYNQGEFAAGLGDVQRVEVLNGPQGTLFGKNSTAGVINVTTNDPTDKVEGTVEASVTTDDEVYLRGMVNAPLTEGIRLRVAGFYQNLSPQVKNLSGDDAYGLRAYGVRAKLAFDLGPNTTFNLAGTYSRSRSSQNQYIIIGPSILNGFANAAGVTIPMGVGGTTVSSNSPAIDIYVTKI